MPTKNQPLLPHLSSLGFSKEEASVYLSLLENGPQTASQLAKTTLVKRTYTYKIADHLSKRGLISQTTGSRGALYSPLPPDTLLSQAQQQQIAAQNRLANLESLIPQLAMLYSLQQGRPIITYHPGIDGVKRVYLDTLQVGQPISALVETSNVNPGIYRWVTGNYVHLRIKAGIHVRAIVSSGQKTPVYTAKDQQEMRLTKVIPKEKYPFQQEINIYGQKIALINHQRDVNPQGIIIDHPQISRTFAAWFDLSWSLLP